MRDILRRTAKGRDFRTTASACAALLAYNFPLNVRELEQALSVACVLAADGVIDVNHLPAVIAGAASSSTPASSSDAPSGDPLDTLDDSDVSPEQQELRARLVASLQAHRGNVTDVARALGRTRMQIHRWMKRLGIDPATFRP